jgi:hypothetical protein
MQTWGYRLLWNVEVALLNFFEIAACMVDDGTCKFFVLCQ